MKITRNLFKHTGKNTGLINRGYPFPYGDSLVLYVPLYDSALSGSPFGSWDVYKHSCTVYGAVWTPQGRRFDGDDYINIDAALTPLASTTTGTWVTWIKLDDATPAASATVFSFGDTDANELILMYLTSPAGELRVFLTDATVRQWDLDTDAAALSDGVWSQIALIQDGVSPVLLVNGVAVAQAFTDQTDKTAWFSVCTGLDNGRIGCYQYNTANNTGFITNGNLGEVWIYNRALSVAEVLQNYEVTKWRYL